MMWPKEMLEKKIVGYNYLDIEDSGIFYLDQSDLNILHYIDKNLLPPSQNKCRNMYLDMFIV